MAMLTNRVQLIGHLGTDPEKRSFESGTKRSSFSLATTSNYKNGEGEWVKDTQWHRIICWGKTADKVEDKLKKGDKILLSGKLTYRSYKDEKGDTHYVTEVVADDTQLLISNANKEKETKAA